MNLHPYSQFIQSVARQLLVILLPLSMYIEISAGRIQYISYSCVITRISNLEAIYENYYYYWDQYVFVEPLVLV
ncbi:MAG: hypothetical protein ACFFEE_12205, partial [Candidatus Thorarchaeota archaeon]